MLESNFVLPEKEISIAETKKRNELINWFVDYINKAVVGFFVTGSMSYGQNYSVKTTSDIDMQLIVTPNTVSNLKQLDCFNADELEKAIKGYEKNLYQQFSLVFQKDGVNMECHFWDQQAFISAITYVSSETKRLRSTIETPSTDHGYSFRRQESVKDYFGELVEGVPVGVFPSFRVVDNVLYLCRPITNILGLPKVIKTNTDLDRAMDATWSDSIKRLAGESENGFIDLTQVNLTNTLPGKNKMSDFVLNKIQERTQRMLAQIGIKSKV